MPLAWVSCAGSRFRGTNREFVQSNECEPAAVQRVPLEVPSLEFLRAQVLYRHAKYQVPGI